MRLLYIFIVHGMGGMELALRTADNSDVTTQFSLLSVCSVFCSRFIRQQ